MRRLDSAADQLQSLFDMRDEIEHSREQLKASQRELMDDFPEIRAAGSLEKANLPDAAQGRVRAFHDSVAEYDRLVKRHNALAKSLEPYLKGRSPEEVHKVLRAMRALRSQLADMLEDANYTKALYVAQHAKLVQALGLESP